MKVYRIKHKPTGLYYTPTSMNGSNLSSKGKAYVGKPPKTEDKDCIRIQLHIWSGDRINKNQKKIIDYFNIQPDERGTYWANKYFRGEKDNWEVEEIE